MKASSLPTVSAVDVPAGQELTAYTYFTHFNAFFFSRSADGTPQFLLHNTTGASAFSHFAGSITEHDPILSFAIARDFVSKTRGLLSSQNITQFLADNTSPVNITELALEDTLREPVRPQKGFTPAIDDICLQVCETPFRFQDADGTITLFIEIPMLNVEALNEAARQCEVDIQAKYFTSLEISDENNEQVSEAPRQCFDEPALYQYIDTYIIKSEPIEITGHYAMISCDPTATTSMLRSLHYSVFRKHGEVWKYYRAYENEFPSDEELQNMKGVLIPGSPHSAYETGVSWYEGLFNFQRKLINEYSHIKLLCICFGAQSLATALGGRVAKMDGPYIRGGETLQIQPSFYEFGAVRESGLDRSRELVIAESHGDHIVELPPGAVLQASSVRTNVEIYTIGKNVLALQGHPEYNEIWTAGANFRIKKPYVEDYDVYAKEYMRAQFPNAVCHKELLSFCFSTLKN